MERELTLEEKTLLIEGHNNWNTYEIKDLDIVKTTMCDGPLGLRKEVGNNSDFGLKKSCLATAFPASINLSTSFNEDIAFKVGKAIGKECIANDVDILLAPGVNIVSTYLNNSYAMLSGTSMATPHVTGALALLIEWSIKEFGRRLTEAELYGQLIKNTETLDMARSLQGNGLLFMNPKFVTK